MANNQETSDSELTILENIYLHSDHVRQRDLAKIAGLSLGMTNSIVKRLATKGWLKIRKVNNRNIMYAVSPAGLEQIARRSYRFVKRTIRNIVYYRESIEGFVQDVKARGFRSLVLVGMSDLDFIVEHACGTFGIEYVREDRRVDAAGQKDDTLFMLYSERHIPDEEEKLLRPGAAFLQEIVGGTIEGSEQRSPGQRP